MDSKIIELLRLKGMGGFSSFILQYYWSILAIIFVLMIGLLVTFVIVTRDIGSFVIVIPMGFLFFLITIMLQLIIATGFETPFNNLNSISINKNITITEYHHNYLLDDKHRKYQIGLLKNSATSSMYKRANLKDQINNKPTKVKIIKYRGENIIINYTPQKQ